MNPDIINFNDPTVWDIFKKGKLYSSKTKGTPLVSQNRKK